MTPNTAKGLLQLIDSGRIQLASNEATFMLIARKELAEIVEAAAEEEAKGAPLAEPKEVAKEVAKKK